MFDIQRMSNRDLELSIANRIPTLGEYLESEVKEAFLQDTTTGTLIAESDVYSAEEEAYGVSSAPMPQGKTSTFEPKDFSKIKKLTKEEYQNSEYFRPGIEWKDDFSEARARVYAEAFDASEYRKSIIQRGGNTLVRKALGFGAAMIGTLPDPVNLIPFGKALGLGKTVGRKVLESAFEGAAGNLAASSITRTYWEDRGVESDWSDYVNDILVGGALGGSLGFLGAKISDFTQARKNIPLKDKQALARGLEKGIMDIEEGKAVDLSEVEGFQEAVDNLWDFEDVKNSEQLQKLEKDLVDFGFSGEDARTSLAPMVAHAKTYSKYYDMDFDTFLREKTLSDVETRPLKTRMKNKARNLKTREAIRADRSEAPEIKDLINTEIRNMMEEIREAEAGRRQIVQVVNQANNEGYVQNINNSQKSSFPSWYKDLKVKNKNDFFKVAESGKGKRYKRLEAIARERLMKGYESISQGKVMPNNEYLKLMGREPVYIDSKGQRAEKGIVTAFNGHEGVIKFGNGESVYFDAQSLGNRKPPAVGEEVHFSVDKNADFLAADELLQGQQAGPRGSVSFTSDGRTIMSLFETADKSTFIHETGHIFLKNMEELASTPGAPKQVVEDFKTIKSWLGAEGQKTSRKTKTLFSVDQHEKFARGFELYAREGKAPNSALARAFDTFRDWLRSIYDSSKKLNVEINDDVRGVYDRLLGGEEFRRFVPKVDEIADVFIENHPDNIPDLMVDEIYEKYHQKELSPYDEIILDEFQVKVDELEKRKQFFKELPQVFTLFQGNDERANHLADLLGVSYEEALEMVREVTDSGYKLEDAITKDKFLEYANKNMKKAEVEQTLAKKRAALTVLAKGKLRNYIGKVLDQGHSVEDAILSIFEGKNAFRDIQGSGNSVFSVYDSLKKYWYGDLEGKLEDIKTHSYSSLLKRAQKDPELTENIIKEMWQLNEGASPATVTGDLEAFEAAKVLKSVADDARERLNMTGSNVRYLDNWAPQHHNYEDLIRAGREKWIKDVRSKIDVKRTFGKKLTDEQLDEELAKIYQKISTGHGEDIKGQDLDVMKTEAEKVIEEINSKKRQTRNVSKRHDQARELHFKSAEDQIEYNKLYGGNSNAISAVVAYLDRSARTLSLTERFGSNPEYTLNLILEEYRDGLADGTFLPDLDDNQRRKAIEKLPTPSELAGRQKNIGRAMAEAMGETLLTENITASQVGSITRSWITLSKLGAATLAQLPDAVNQANERFILREMPLLDAWRDTMNNYFHKLTPDKKRILDRIGVISDGILGDSINRWNAQDKASGKMNQALNFMFKINGMQYLTNKTKGGFALSMAKDLGEFQGSRFVDLPRGYQEALKQFGNIDALKWEVIRKSKSIQDAKGGKYLTPDLVRGIPEEAFNILLPEKFKMENMPLFTKVEENVIKAWESTRAEMIKRKRIDLEQDLRSFFVEETRNAILEPDARTRRYVVQGTRPGTWTGEAIRYMMQFKSFAFTAAHRTVLGNRSRVGTRGLGSALYESARTKSLNPLSDIDGLSTGSYAAASLLLGYMSLVSKDLSKGREPRDYARMETWIEAAAQSGGAGIIGDFMFNPSNRYGGSLVGTLAGPAASTFDDMHKIYSKVLMGETDIASDTVNLVKWNIPYQSLWWSRAALDYAIFHHLREMTNPGSLRRAERRMKRESGQEYLVSPSKALGY